MLVPVLGRPQAVRPLLDSFLASGAERDAELLFIASETDVEEIAAIEAAGVRCLLTPKRSWACKINVGLRWSTEPWILCAADDVTFVEGWTQKTLAHMRCPVFPPSSLRFAGDEVIGDRAAVVSTYDGFNDATRNGELATHPLVSRRYAVNFGTIDNKNEIAHEGYHHNYVDEEITLTARVRGRLHHSPVQILEHHHWGRHPERMDATYALGHSFLEVDKALFEARKARILTLASDAGGHARVGKESP